MFAFFTSKFNYFYKIIFKINCPKNLIDELYLINKTLWDIEDLLRILENKKDFSTNRGLMRMVGRRKRLLQYLNHTDLTSYRSLIEKLGIRK